MRRLPFFFLRLFLFYANGTECVPAIFRPLYTIDQAFGPKEVGWVISLFESEYMLLIAELNFLMREIRGL